MILDAKRGDIGATAEQYAREAFERYRADAVTLSPLMGFDSIEPYLRYAGKGLFLLCRTSNPGGADLQAQPLASRRTAVRAHRRAGGGADGIASGPARPRRRRHLPGRDRARARARADAAAADPRRRRARRRRGRRQCAPAGGRTAPIIVNSSRAVLYASAPTRWLRRAPRAASRWRPATCCNAARARDGLSAETARGSAEHRRVPSAPASTSACDTDRAVPHRLTSSR